MHVGARHSTPFLPLPSSWRLMPTKMATKSHRKDIHRKSAVFFSQLLRHQFTKTLGYQSSG